MVKFEMEVLTETEKADTELYTGCYNLLLER
jgi:hypothetical protein